MELQGKVVSLLPEQSGQGQKGAWRKQEYIIETQGQYPKKVCLAVWGDRIDQYGLKVGDNITASIDVESREFNGRWYTDVKAWKIEKQGEGASSYAPDYASESNNYTPPSGAPLPDEEDDLPF